MNRREFVINLSLLPVAGILGHAIARAAGKVTVKSSKSDIQPGMVDFFDNLIEKGRKKNWGKLPIGESIGNIALEFLGTPYVAGTLECDGPEV